LPRGQQAVPAVAAPTTGNPPAERGWCSPTSKLLLVAVDVETTGLDAPIDIVEVGLAGLFYSMTDDKYTVVEWSRLVKPRTKISTAAQVVHNITPEMVTEASVLEDVLAYAWNVIQLWRRQSIQQKGKLMLVAHNGIAFDYAVMRDSLGLHLSPRLVPDWLSGQDTDIMHTDSLLAVRRLGLYPGRQASNLKLKELYGLCFPDSSFESLGLRLHRAGADAALLARCCISPCLRDALVQGARPPVGRH
jgi:DNA polymerase III epsilon subunit-like protein